MGRYTVRRVPLGIPGSEEPSVTLRVFEKVFTAPAKGETTDNVAQNALIDLPHSTQSIRLETG
jgi:hypothetical protein